MSDPASFANVLRFVAAHSDRSDPRIAAMMDILGAAADAIEATGGVTVAAAELELAARAFAGVAGFLQQRILPETVAAANKAGEEQVRAAVDASMDAVNRLLREAAGGAGQPVALSFT
ncbi:MAG: hypothetical protein ACM33T_00210 [Solirubrobacterales bacterium]